MPENGKTGARAQLDIGALSLVPDAVAAELDVFERLRPFKAKIQPTNATITGVGFFDRVHDQMGLL